MFRANKSGGRLTKLRYVCSMCSVNCIDEHGFAQHLRSQKHMENEMQEEERRRLNGPKAYEVDAVSARFEESFLELLAARHLDQRVLAHEVYHEAFHNDRPMHALKKTCWGSFGQFITSLRDRGRLDAERDAKGWLVCLVQLALGLAQPAVGCGAAERNRVRDTTAKQPDHCHRSQCRDPSQARHLPRRGRPRHDDW